MTETEVVVTRAGKVATIRLNRPRKSNSLTIAMLQDLKEALVNTRDEEKVRIVVLTGTGENFTTGMDVNALKDLSDHERPDTSARMERLGAETARLIIDGKPTICAINGRAMGMGVVWALASDFRLAVESTTFQMPEIHHSIYPAANCITLMTLQLGVARTKEILMRCQSFTAAEAMSWGLVNELVPASGFEERVATLAKELSRNNPVLMQRVKLNVNAVHFQPSFDAASELERQHFAGSYKKATGS